MRFAADWGKGMPAPGTFESSIGDAIGLDLFEGGFVFPTMVLRESALAHNIELFARYCRARGVDLAPHGKTTMVPAIHRRQLAAGAWAITVATVVQAHVAAKAGIPRILIANEIVDDAGLDWLAAVLEGSGPEVLCLADSIAGVDRMSSRLMGRHRALPVLVEVGVPGGRAGARTVDEALAVARAIAASPALHLAGVEFFEGIVQGDSPPERDLAIRALIDAVRQVATSIDAEPGLSKRGELIVSGGGSQDFDTVITALTQPWATSAAPRIVVRSGCYVTHDHGRYDNVSPFGSGAPTGSPRLQPALEVWANILSTPEPGLAIAGAGRRDLPYDAGMPVPIKVRRTGSSAISRLNGVSVNGLNDQHAYLAFDREGALEVGDRVGFGISHPCSAFDRWRFIPVVDDEYRVLDVYQSEF